MIKESDIAASFTEVILGLIKNSRSKTNVVLTETIYHQKSFSV